MERLTEETIGCFQYDLKDFIHKVGEFNDYDAFYAYNMAIRKLGKYEDTGLEPEGFYKYKKFKDDIVETYNCELKDILHLLEIQAQGRLVELPEQDFSQMNDYLEPLKVYSALKSELQKLEFRKKSRPDSISILDYTIIYALKNVLETKSF